MVSVILAQLPDISDNYLQSSQPSGCRGALPKDIPNSRSQAFTSTSGTFWVLLGREKKPQLCCEMAVTIMDQTHNETGRMG